MKKGLLFTLALTFVLFLAGCEKSWDYRFYETEIVFGE
jgi:hypothetical protein